MQLLSSDALASDFVPAKNFTEKCTGTDPVTGDEFIVYVRKKTVGDVLKTANDYQNGASIQLLFAKELAASLLDEKNQPIFTEQQILSLNAASGWFAELSRIYLSVNPPLTEVKKN